MKKLTRKKNIIQKITIMITAVLLLNFITPKVVQADLGGKLMSPIVTFLTFILDGIQHGLEFVMLGETSDFMKPLDDESINKEDGEYGISIEQDIDGSFLGLDSINVPVITYTPEEIFSNRVPALDINFISPSIHTGNENTDNKRNVAIRLQPIISSWYSALRIIAIVGLMSVLVYLGIRMLLTSIAADKARYKKMIGDWIIAMCLVLVLHYIMSFALTLTEAVTGMLSSDIGKTITVTVPEENLQQKIGVNGDLKFNTNLMGYIRFMVQASKLSDKITFFILYAMLVFYSVKFTWTYLKRVVNMAFLTLMAPLVSLTYPIDKVSDGKAQAFDMWIKEFTFNALIQPLHLLLYTVLLGSAIELAAENPLYAIVCLGFIIAAEKLLKQMFGFNKASGGTVGSLAGAAGVTALASKAIGAVGNKAMGGGSKNGKIRTKESPERTGRDANSTKKFDSFNKADARGIPEETSQGTQNDTGMNQDSDEGEVPAPSSQERDNSAETGGNLAQRGNIGTDTGIDSEETRPNTEGSPNPEMTREGLEETWSSLRAADKEASKAKWDARKENMNQKMNNVKNAFTKEGRKELRRKAGAKAYKTIRGVKHALPTAAYSMARGGVKLAARGMMGAALGASALAIGATTGDAEKAISMAAAGMGAGVAFGGKTFEGTVGKVAKSKSITESFGSGKYGNAEDARNAKADKEYLKSDQFDDFYEKFYKGKKSKKDVKQAVLDYRRAGIIDNTTIRKALILEENYQKDGISAPEARANVQNIVQTKDDVDKLAFHNKQAKAAELERIKSSLTNVPEANRDSVARQIFKGYEDYRKI